jgi:Protein of unknown function (DUF4199)
MKKVVLTFGLLSGAVAAAMMFMTLPFAERIGFDRSIVVGYTIIVISMLFVYFGVRSYRDNVLGGSLTFGDGLKAGLLISLISSVCYVLAWLVLFYGFMPDFVDQYSAWAVDTARASGASETEVAAKIREVDDARKLLENPLSNAAVSFLEPFPVGLIVTVISAAVLKRKSP